MSDTVCINNTRTNDFSVLNIVDFKLFGMTEVLEDLSAFVSCCNFHFDISFVGLVFNDLSDLLN